ncbi:immunity 49 family protein [Kitasatospora sp. NPDC088134]|uniref:immunity 49 family protein n=1 Tax=Kitasatospora sp. NPDC088134 TaxID=3364071 RepID=UPI003818934B
MTTFVAGHLMAGPGAEGLAERLSEQAAEEIGELDLSAEEIDSAFGSAFSAFWAHCLVDAEAAHLRTRRAAVVASEVGTALFAVTAVEEGTVQCFLDGRVREIPATGWQTYADADNWLDAFYLALICRDGEQARWLCGIPVERLRAAPDDGDDGFTYAWIEALQAHRLQRPDAATALAAAREAARDAAEQLQRPLVRLLAELGGGGAEFGPALVEAVELHRAYWTATEERAGQPAGGLALGALALACWAFDLGHPVAVESPYLPVRLIDRAWPGGRSGTYDHCSTGDGRQ